MATVALAIWRVTVRRPALRSCLFASVAAGLVYANVAFWRGLDLAHNTGMRAAVATILERIRPGESIVATDGIQYTTAKFYAGRRAPIHLLEPPPGMFWGWHLIRPDDVISPEELRDELARGIWLVGPTSVPLVSPKWGLDDAQQLETYEYHYYCMPNHNTFVNHYAGLVDRHSDEVAGRAGG